MTVSIVAEALKDVQDFFRDLPDLFEEAAAISINDVVQRQGLTTIKKNMRSQVSFPSGYLEGGGRLSVKRKASRRSLEAVIAGRDRPTSLARFASGQTPENTRGRGVRVQIKPGHTTLLKKAFVVNLKNGNRGVAVRVGPGQRLEGSSGAKRLANDLYLLYGPSVEQVFAGVADDVTPYMLNEVSRRFTYQVTRLLRAR